MFATVVEANYVTKKQDLFSAYKLTEEDKEEIEKLSKDPNIGEKVFLLRTSFAIISLFYAVRTILSSFTKHSDLRNSS